MPKYAPYRRSPSVSPKPRRSDSYAQTLKFMELKDVPDHQPSFHIFNQSNTEIPSDLMSYSGMPTRSLSITRSDRDSIGLDDIELEICSKLSLSCLKYKEAKKRVFAYFHYRKEAGLSWSPTHAQEAVRANTTMISALFRVWHFLGLFGDGEGSPRSSHSASSRRREKASPTNKSRSKKQETGRGSKSIGDERPTEDLNVAEILLSISMRIVVQQQSSNL